MRTYVIPIQIPMKNERPSVMTSPKNNYHTNFSSMSEDLTSQYQREEKQ